MRTGIVWIGGSSVIAHLACTLREAEIGLRGLGSLSPNEGLLLPTQPGAHLSMTGMRFPLDAVLIVGDRVARVLELEPGQPSIPVDGADYVLELNRGWSRRHGIGPGSSVAAAF
jgi:uncharacterized membrane protein (UPF0127 family)